MTRWFPQSEYKAAHTYAVEIARQLFQHLPGELGRESGIQHLAPVEEFPADKWDAIIAINLSSSFHTIRAALPGMKKRGWGRVLNIASVHGLVASAQKSAYVAAKHGLYGFTKTIALEGATFGIRANYTPLFDNLYLNGFRTYYQPVAIDPGKLVLRIDDPKRIPEYVARAWSVAAGLIFLK